MRQNNAVTIIVTTLIIIALYAIYIGLLMWLWNAQLYEIFELHRISYWDAFWISLFIGFFVAPNRIK